MAITSATRKRLWARSGNRCALCRQELVRNDVDDLDGALVGEEAHIVARSQGGPRYERLDPKVRDGHANVILLCANDHAEIDAHPTRYTVEGLQLLKLQHENWVATQLGERASGDSSSSTLATQMQSGSEIWDLTLGAFAYQYGSPEGLTDEDAELVDQALQTFTDWADVATEVVLQGFRAIREGKQSLQAELDALTAAGFVVLGGERQGHWDGGTLTGKIAVLEIVSAKNL